MSGRNKKNLIIIALIAIVVVMSVAYAAFATSLNITGTSNIASNWNIEITNITTLEKSSGANNAAGSPTYDNTNGLTASINTTLTSPGDYAIYKIEVTNKGSLNAVLSSITGPTNNNNDIIFYVNKNQNNEDITDTSRMIGANDILNARGDSNNLDKGYVYVTVLYRDYENQQTPEIATANATVTLNFTQSSSGSSPDTINGTIYRWSTDNWSVNQDISSMTAGEDYVTTAGAVTNMDALGAKFYLKHTVVNNIVIDNYVCFVSDAEHCLKAGGAQTSEIVSPYYKYEEQGGNWAVIKSQESWFENANGSCSFDSSSSHCEGGGFSSVYVSAYGGVDVYDSDSSSRGCIATNEGSSRCN